MCVSLRKYLGYFCKIWRLFYHGEETFIAGLVFRTADSSYDEYIYPSIADL